MAYGAYQFAETALPVWPNETNNSPMQIGQVIRSLREEKGWSREALAHESGVGITYVSRIERGDRRLSTSKLNALATALVGTSATAVCAQAEGLPVPAVAQSLDGDLTLDHTKEAVDFAQMLSKQSVA